MKTRSQMHKETEAIPEIRGLKAVLQGGLRPPFLNSLSACLFLAALLALSQPVPAEERPARAANPIRKEPPAGSEKLVAAAQRAFEAGRYEEAEKNYLQVLHLDENNVLILGALATVQLNRGNLTEVEKTLNKALILAPDDANNLSLLGFLKFRQKRLPEAVDALSRAAKRDPDNAQTQNFLGMVLTQSGQRRAAEAALRRAIELNPNYADAHFNLAIIEAFQRPPKLEPGREHYQKAVGLGHARNQELERQLFRTMRDPTLETKLGARRIVAAGWKPSWSPDATRLAYARYPGEGTMVLDLASGKSTEVSPNGKDPAWSPDGRWIAFVCVVPSPPQVTGTLAEQVWLVETNGSNPRFLAQGGFPGWSCDGKLVYVHSRRENRIMSVPVNGPSPKPSVFYYQPLSGYPAVLPDGSRIAFGPPGKLIIVNPLTEQATRTWPNSSIYASLPAWSPDGKRVTFGSEDPLSGLWLGETETGHLTQLARGPYGMPDWSRDGTKLAFDYRGGDQHEIWVIETRNLPGKDVPTPMAILQQLFNSLSPERQDDLASMSQLWPQTPSDNVDPADLDEFLRALSQVTESVKAAKYQEAIPVVRRMVDVLEKANGTNSIANVSGASALVALCRKTGNTAEVERWSERILDLCLNSPESNRLEASPLLQTTADLLAAGGDYSRSARLLERAVTLEQTNSGAPSRALARRLGSLARAYGELEELDKAEAVYLRAVTTFETAYGKQAKETAIVLDNFGALYERRGQYAQAARLHERALSVFEKALGPEQIDTGICALNLGRLYISLHDVEKAERFSQRALEIIQKVYGLESQQAALPLMELGSVYVDRGYTAEAEPLLQLALRLYEKFEGPEGKQTAICLNNLSGLYERTGRYTEAEQLYLRSLDIIQKRLGPEDSLVATRLLNLAGLYWAMHKPEKAEPLYLRAIAIAGKRLGPEHPRTGGFVHNLAFFYLSLGKRPEALDLARKAESARLKALANVLSFTSEQQRLMYQANLQPFTLFGSLGEAGDLAAAVFRHKGLVLDSLLEDRLAAQASRNPQHRTLVEHWRAAKQQLMQLVLESAKDAEPADRERQERTKADLITEVERLEGELARRVAGLGHARRALSVTVPQVQKAIPGQSVLVEFIHYLHIAEGAQRSTRGPMVDADPRYGAILLGPSGEPKWIPLGDAQAIEKNLQRYQAAVHGGSSSGSGARGDGASLSSLLQALYQQLWAPIEAALPRNTKIVILSPDDALNFCSFATLLAPDDRFLSQKYSIRYVSSGRDLLKTKPPAKSARLLIFAHPDFARAEPSRSQVPLGTQVALRSLERSDWRNLRLPSLPGTAAESEALAERARRWGWPCQTYLAAQATEAELDKIESPRVLHLATHGFFLPEVEPLNLTNADQWRGVGGVRPRPGSGGLLEVANSGPRPPLALKNPMHRSGLALAGAQATLEAWNRGETPPANNDGIVTADEVGGLDLTGTELVVLSACETGAGQLQSGEGVLGLRRGFLQAGAQNLLLTLWAIRDEETASIMVDFYETFHARENAPEALASVQRDWLVRLRQSRGLEAAVVLAGPFILSFHGEAK